MEELSDLDLLARAQASPAAARRAFTVLVRRHERALFNFILRTVHARALAEELFQDTFLRALRSLGSFRTDGPNPSVRAWLYRIAVNLCRDEVRSARFQAAHALSEELGDDLPHGGPTPEAAAAIEQRAKVVRAAVMSLSEAQREVVLLFQYQGLSYPEIAVALDIPLGTVKSRMHAALSSLGKKLSAPDLQLESA
ncbi:MAG: sigma-70 family RNA polymerase sigma factor [Deltaproteobacteria bacterium]|nr:sigma-70 family RNA polymerase sigma factor [Deltaproteobacteria bacterium]